ncbi:hypothetical protein M8J75_006545 [Diaphorina citri]|nr:hypothetical protein M8J75_006545 [Diaphorina citri]
MATETLSGNSDNQGWFSSWKSCNLDCSRQKFRLRESYSKCTKLFTSLVHSKCTKLYMSDWWFRTDSLSITATSVMVLGAGESPPRSMYQEIWTTTRVGSFPGNPKIWTGVRSYFDSEFSSNLSKPKLLDISLVIF